MIRFESDNIVVGYIKNLLTTFNLPMPKVYKYEDDTYAVENQLYIKDDYICQYRRRKLKEKTPDGENYYTESEFRPVVRYEEGLYYPNYTTNLKFTGITYDWNTHEYLGEYLRFIRDYKGLNLMSLYNCCSNRFAKNLIYTPKNINSNDTNYKILMIPVKLNQEYTIAIESSVPYEIFCGCYGVTNYNLDLIDKTYTSIARSNFYDVVHFDKLTQLVENKSLYSRIAKAEKDLKMFIKIPSSVKSSVVVLEGNYLSNTFAFKKSVEDDRKIYQRRYYDPYQINYTKMVYNFKPEEAALEETNGEYNYSELINKMPTQHQLLRLNTGINYPFADKLISYLCDNTICKLDTIDDNIKRVQWNLYTKYIENYKDEECSISYGLKDISHNYGIWDEKYNLVLYNLAKEKNLINTKFDILGNVDKDIEKYIDKDFDIYSKEDK